MGVTGLWRLIEPAGKPVPVETLENKVLAVDISIWLHQMVKGYQDAKGAPLPNAHLMGLFQRLCKLLYFRIKPVFVFDGAFPDLKKETIAKRQDSKAKYNSESERLKRELAIILSKKTAINSLLGKQISPKKGNDCNAGTSDTDDIFKLPALPERGESESESEDEQNSSGSIVDLHSIDIESNNFKKLPIKEKYDLLVELKETRKMNSWGKLHELPKKSDNFSDFQMQRLLKRRKVQECLEETEKEMGDTGMSLNDLESLLNEEGIDTKIESLPTRRIASNDNTRFLLINNVKQALADAKKKKECLDKESTSTLEEEYTTDESISKKDELENDLEKAIKMSLECVNELDTSACTSKTDNSWTSCLTDSDYSDSHEEDGFERPDISSAKAYIMQYSDFTNKAIEEIVTCRKNNNINIDTIPNVNQILDEINMEKSVIIDNVTISSEDEDSAENDTNFKSILSRDQSVIELNSTVENLAYPSRSCDKNATHSSIIYIENPVQGIVTLDSSTEENEKDDAKDNSCPEKSDTSDDEFEDVPEIETKPETVVQLILNTNNVPDDDDMFADVFSDGKDSATKNIDVVEVAKNIVDRKMCSIKTPIISELSNYVTVEDMKSKTKNVTEMSQITEETEKVVSAKEKTDYINVNENCHTKANIEKPNVIDSNGEKDYVIEKQQNNINPQTVAKKINNLPKEPIITENLNTMVEEIQNEEQDLLEEKGRLDRVGRNITEQMTKEAQELLQIFGIPYVVAPMEAEAQCAFLESVNLTDGTITDDSDIWLFGGRTVYKNFFNQKKHVLQFLADRIEKSFNLNREQLVLLALLVGSDYTTGVSGVGPVTALEILASFPFNKKPFINETSKQARYAQVVTGLQEFKRWVRAGKRTDNTSLKKKLKNVDLTEDFPSVRVVQAYLEPNVEKSEDKFTWGDMDITILRDYTKAKFGWSQNKLDEIIKPVINRRLERKSQKSVQDYFKRKIDFQSLEDQMSKRVKAAVQRMGPGLSVPSEEQNVSKQTSKSTKRKVNKSKTESGEPNETKPNNCKQRQNDEIVLNDHSVKVVSQMQDGKSSLEIKIPKSDRIQEIIPQREKDKQNLLQNKMKAIEVFRKTKIDRKKIVVKKKAIQPKEKAELSESSDSD